MYEFTQLSLERDEFDNLMFMGPPSRERDRIENEWLLSLCNLPLKEVANSVIAKATDSGSAARAFGSIDVISNKYNHQPWFKPHEIISQHFHKNLMDRIWIRNLSDWDSPDDKNQERLKQPNCSFYVIDGNKRSLVYAVMLQLGQMPYVPVEALHSASWDFASGILGWQGWPGNIDDLVNDGKLRITSKHRLEATEPGRYTMLVGEREVEIKVNKRITLN